MNESIANYFHLEFQGLGDALEIRSDIPPELQGEIYSSLLREYRQIFGEESPRLRGIDKSTSIGMLERAIRTKSAINLPLAEPTVSPDYYRSIRD